MNDKKLQRLDQLLAAFDTGAVQPNELIQAIEAVMAVVTTSQKELLSRIDTTRKDSENDIDELERAVVKANEQITSLIRQVKEQGDLSVAEIKALVAKEVERLEMSMPEMPDEFDASDILSDIEKHNQILNNLSVLITGENIRNALEVLPEGEKLAISAIEGLEEALTKRAEIKSQTTALIVSRIDQINDVVLTNLTDGQTLVWDATNQRWVNGSASGSTTFTALTDTPASYTSQGGKLVRVNTAEDALEFIDPPSGTGDVVGPASATNNNIALFDGITGKLIKDSGVATSAFATSAQGALADTASQPGHTHVASDVTDFQAAVSANTDVAANTGARHSAVTLAGVPDYITLAGQVITRSLINLASHVTGRLPFANLTQLSAHQVLGRAGSGTGDVAGITMGNDTILGRSGSGNVDALSATQVRTILNVEDGAEVNNISDANATDLTDGGETTLHTHAISGVTGLQAALDLKQNVLSEGAFVNGDKTKLNGIETGAQVNTVTPTNTVTLTNKTLGTGTTNGADQDVAGFDLRDIALSGFKITTASVTGTTAINWNDGAFQEITLTGNTTLTFTAPTGDANNGWRLQLLVKQDATGGRTLALPTVKTPGGAAYTVSSGANDEDILTFYYNGVSYYLVDSKDFS